jgi:hypothetical protein
VTARHDAVDVLLGHVDDELGADLGVDVLARPHAIIVGARFDLQPVEGAILPEQGARDPRLEVHLDGHAGGRRGGYTPPLARHALAPGRGLLVRLRLRHLADLAQLDPRLAVSDANAEGVPVAVDLDAAGNRLDLGLLGA